MTKKDGSAVTRQGKVGIAVALGVFVRVHGSPVTLEGEQDALILLANVSFCRFCYVGT